VVGLRNVTNRKARAYKPDTAAARACVVVDAACQNFSRRRSFLESRRCLYIFLRKEVGIEENQFRHRGPARQKSRRVPSKWG
jgi:hypothetical protein